MNLISVANETIRIYEKGEYEVNGKKVVFPEGDYRGVFVFSPEMGEEVLREEFVIPANPSMCKISVINSDSYAAARRFDKGLVMNFANAHSPGGGFRMGATAQEEALCRCSTLYESITSKTAAQMYVYNNTHISNVESDYMLFSKDVLVFRDEHLNLLEEPFKTSVVTIPAPNRYGAAALASSEKIKNTFERRIAIMIKEAKKLGYRQLVLGAWGCGAFGNKPKDVAEYFKKAITDDKLGYFFDEICFAVYGKEDGKNITAFREVFKDCIQ